MRRLRHFSNLIALAGIALVVAGWALDLNPTVTLVGLMLVVAGIVKIVAVALWCGVGDFGVPLASTDAERQRDVIEPRHARRSMLRRRDIARE